MKYIKVYEASSNNKFSLKKINMSSGHGYNYVIVSKDSGEDATFDEMIVDGKIDKEIVKMCSSGNKKMMLSVLKLVEKWPVSKLKAMQYLALEIIDKPVKLYDMEGKEIAIPNMICTNVTGDNDSRIFMTNFDKKPEFAYAKFMKSISMIDDMYAMVLSSAKPTEDVVDKIKNMNNIEKNFFSVNVNWLLGQNYHYNELRKIVSRITNKNKMKYPKLFDVDGFDFFGDD